MLIALVALVSFAAVAAFILVPQATISGFDTDDAISLITESERQYRDRLEEITRGERDSVTEPPAPDNEAIEDESVEVVIKVHHASTKVTPMFGVCLLVIAVIYVAVLAYQIIFGRDHRRRRGSSSATDSSLYDDEEYYSDVSRSDDGSKLYDSTPNTISYMDSQLYTPNASIFNSGHRD